MTDNWKARQYKKSGENLGHFLKILLLGDQPTLIKQIDKIIKSIDPN